MYFSVLYAIVHVVRVGACERMRMHALIRRPNCYI